MRFKCWTGIALASLLAGCGQSPEQVAAGTSHCSGVRVAPDMVMRLSQYYSYPDSIAQWIVRACRPTGTGCVPILIYDHAPPPIYAVRGKAVTIEVLGGMVREIHGDRAPRAYRFAVHQIKGRVSDDARRAFYARIRHRCPASNQRYPDDDPAGQAS